MWVLVLVASLALGQLPPPAQPEFRIDFNTRIKDIHWAGGFRVPYTGKIGTPLAQFYLSAVPISVPANWTGLTYHWDEVEVDIDDQEEGGPPWLPPTNRLLVTSPGTGQNIWGRAYMTGLYTTRCTVHYYDTILQALGEYVIPTTKQVYVLGGPLEFSVKPPGFGNPAPPNRDAFESGPHYLQYFNYDPAFLFQSNFPGMVQRAQTGHVEVQYAQPGDVPHIDWELDGAIKFVGECASEPQLFTEIDVGATGSSTPGAITVDATIYVTVDIDGIQVTMPSEIDPMEWPAYDPDTGDWFEDDDIFKFTSHEPKDIVETAPHAYVNWYPLPDSGFDAHQYFEVTDTNGVPMPALWVQERFSFGVSYWWGDWNESTGQPYDYPNEYWGYIYSINTAGPGVGFRTNLNSGGPSINPNYWISTFPWTTSPPPTDSSPLMRGVFTSPDIFTIHLPSQSWPYTGAGGLPPFFDFTHTYHAATKDAFWSPPGILPPWTVSTLEIKVGTYLLKMWTDHMTHIKQGP